VKTIPIYRGGAADAQLVGRARAAYLWRSQRLIQPGDCCGPTANAHESGIRPPSRATHPLPGQASTGNALGRHPNGTHPAAIVVGTESPAPPSGALPKERIRPPSRPTALRRNACGRHHRDRPRTPTWLAGQRVPPGWCRPTSACSPTPLCGDRDRRDFDTSFLLQWHPDLRVRRG
jgi:hypothetical protein